MDQLTTEMIRGIVNKIKNSLPPKGDFTYLLPSPNVMKKLIVHKQDIAAAVKIWRGEATADDFETVEEIELPDIRQIYIKGGNT